MFYTTTDMTDKSVVFYNWTQHDKDFYWNALGSLWINKEGGYLPVSIVDLGPKSCPLNKIG